MRCVSKRSWKRASGDIVVVLKFRLSQSQSIDAAVGWRLPRRLGSISLEGTNLTDEQFAFYEQSLQENLIPARRVSLRADFAF